MHKFSSRLPRGNITHHFRSGPHKVHAVNHSFRFISSTTRIKLEQLLNANKPQDITKLLKEAAQINKPQIPSNTLAQPTVDQLSIDFLSLFGNEHDADLVKLAKDTMACVDSVIPYTKYKATVALINRFCDNDEIKIAWEYYGDPASCTVALDAATMEKFVGKLCDNNMVEEVEKVLTVQRPTIELVEKMMEPYILSGRIHELSLHISFILQSSTIFSKLSQVSFIVELLLKTRLRRSISGAPKTAAESEGVNLIHKELEKFQESLEAIHRLTNKPHGVGRCAATIFNYLDYCREEWDDDSIPAPLPITPDDRVALDALSALEKPSTFKYLIEHRKFYDNDGFLDESPFAVTDFTAELAIDNSRTPLLYKTDLFFNAKDDERRFVTMICNDVLDLQALNIFDETLEELEALEEMDENDDDEEEEDFDEFDDTTNEENDEVVELESFEVVEIDDVSDEIVEHLIRSKESTKSDEDEEFDDEDSEAAEKLASYKPRRRIHDLSRSLYTTFGRCRPNFDDDFFDEMEVISYENPQEVREHSLRSYERPTPDILPDDQGGSFVHQSSAQPIIDK